MATKKAVKKVVSVKKVKPIPHKKAAQVKFVSFSFGATIPTQAFGNVTPRIEVQADTYEAARDFAIPKIEELYGHFAEIKPTFLGKITEKVVNVNVPEHRPEPRGSDVPDGGRAAEAPATVEKQKTEAVLKAEKAIGLAMTKEATEAIEAQIQKSVKIAEEDKPALYTLVLKKRKELKESK